jgi:type II secretory ATPase GspE/PulE/Tfp pilus assembly ATPase PilB-like protein
MAGNNQVNVDDPVGLALAAARRTFFRQDSEVVGMDEIRGIEIAEIAVKTSPAGHLAHANLHTNDASTTLPRRDSTGIAHVNVTSSVTLNRVQASGAALVRVQSAGYHPLPSDDGCRVHRRRTRRDLESLEPGRV